MTETRQKSRERRITYIVPDFDKNFVEGIQKSFVEREFHDLTITNEVANIEIPVHRIVIATVIPALKIHLLDTEISSVKIDLDDELLRAFINFCYTGTLNIDRDTHLLPLYKFCTLNRIDNFQTFFDEEFDDLITLPRVLAILKEYQSNIYDLIQEKCLKIIANNINTVANKPDFANISVLDFGRLLRHDRLAIESEEMVLEIFLKWYYEQPNFTLHSNPIRPTKIIPNCKHVLSAIRLPLIEAKYVKKFAEKIWLIHGENDLLYECKQRRSTRKDVHAAAIDDHNLRMQPRVARNFLLAVGIREISKSYHMELLDGRREKWRTLPCITCQNKNLFRMFCAYVLYTDVENTQNLMIIGGENSRELKKVESINLATKQLKQMTPTQIPRKSHGGALIDNKYIYIAGGISGGNILASVEEYNITTNEWLLVTPMLTARAGCQLIAFKDSIYALGGFNKDTCLNEVEHFDRAKKCWVATTPMLDKRCDFGAVVHQNRIYVLGGNSETDAKCTDFESELDSVEYFDASSKTWTRIASLNRKRDHLSAVVYQNQLIAIAGYGSNAKAQNMVEEYNDETNEWTELSPLNGGTGKMGAFVLSSFD